MSRPETASPSTDVPVSEFASSPRLIIRASAGTGKTFQLSNRYLSLLRRSAPDRILAVTFTRKAAGEILERILLRLADAALDDRKRQDLAKFVAGPDLSQTECEQLLASTVRQLHRLKVSTLDSFFSRIATAIPLEIGLPPGWSIADEHSEQGLMLEAIDEVLRHSDLDATRRLVRILAKGVPRSILNLLTKAVGDHYGVFRLASADAWAKLEPPPLLAAEEFDSLVARLEQLKVDHAGLQKAILKDAVLCRAEDWEAFLADGPANKLLEGETTYSRKPLPRDVRAVYEPLIQHARAILLKQWAHRLSATRQLLAEYDRARRRLMLESQSLRFDDVAVALAERMAAVDARALVHRLDGDVDHLLLDEFQDTSLIQWDVLRPFIQSLDAKEDASFFCVGDTKQAIYGWRGGVAALFDRVQREVAGVRSGVLNESRRSAPEIMQTVNRVFTSLSRHPLSDDIAPHVADWQTAFPEHTTALDAVGYTRLETASGEADADSETKRDRCIGRAVDIAAELVAKRPNVSVGILTRGNDMIGRIIHALAERGIQASEEGGVRLTTSAAVQLVQSLLRFADHPGHSIARYHIAHSPLASLYRIRPEMTENDAHEASRAIRRELSELGYEVALERWANVLKPSCNAREWSRLRRLRSLAARYELQATLRPSDFASRIDEERVEEPNASPVRVMTIHKSKGLEFDAVILPELDCDLIRPAEVCTGCPAPAERPNVIVPRRNSKLDHVLPPQLRTAIDQQKRADVHEALCCLYVAMTRAAHALYMVIAPQLKDKNGNTNPKKTAAGLLHVTLADQPHLPPSTVLDKRGDERWIERLAAAETAPSTPSRPFTSPIAFATGEARSRGREAVSPSQSKQKHSAPFSTLLSRDAANGRQRGTLWHWWCQHLTWLDGQTIDRDRLLRIGQPLDGDPAQLNLECDRFLDKVAAPRIRELFTKQAMLKRHVDLGDGIEIECRNESRFALVQDNQSLSGSIDRLVLYKRSGKVLAADVIDFKTDEAGPRSSLRPAYQEQVRQYAGAVANGFRLPVSRVQAQLAWLATGEVETVSAS